MRLTFDKSVPTESKSELRTLAKRWRGVFMRVVDELHFTVAGDENLDGTKIAVQPEYRRATIMIGVPWFGYEQWQRENHILHEFSHLLTAGALHLAFSWATLLAKGDAAMRTHLFEDVATPLFEAATEDFTRGALAAYALGRREALASITFEEDGSE